MTIRGKFFLENTDDISATLQLTMTIREWRALRAVINDKWPGWNINSMITQLIMQASFRLDATNEEFHA